MLKSLSSVANVSALLGAGLLVACSSSKVNYYANPAVDAGGSSGDRDSGSAADRGGWPGDHDGGAADSGGSPGPFLVRGASKSWHVTSTVTIQNANATLTRLTVLVPAPQTNVYQDVSNPQYGTATQLAIPETDADSYLQFITTSGLPGPGASATRTIEYDVTLYQISVDLGIRGGRVGHET